MKTKEKILKTLESDRTEFINNFNNELVKFEGSVHFDAIYDTIENEIEDQFVRFGDFTVNINLCDFLPKDFEYNYTSEKQCDYYVRDVIIKEIETMGYTVSANGLKLKIS